MGNITKRDTVLNMLVEYKKGKSIAEIGRITNVSRATVHRYINIFNEKFPPTPPTLTTEELELLDVQALEVLESLIYEDRNQSGRIAA